MAKPSAKALGKRKAPPPSAKGGNKKAKTSTKPNAKRDEQETGPTGKPKRKPDQPKKVKLRDQKSIPIPKTSYASGSDIDEDDLGEEEGLGAGSARFLVGVDENALSRSVKETKRLHDLSKTREPLPRVKRQKVKIPLPEAQSDSDDYDFDTDPEFDSDLASDVDMGSGSGIDEDDDDDDDDDDGGSNEDEDQDDVIAEFDNISEYDEEPEDGDAAGRDRKRRKGKKEEEADYELNSRTKWTEKATKKEAGGNEDEVEVGRLPIKLPTGEIRMVEGSTKIALPPSKKPVKKPVESDDDEEEGEDEEDEESDDGAQAEQMAGQKGKFGRMGIAEIVSEKKWKNAEKLAAAKEQMANLGAEILAGGELVDIGPVLTRLSTFALPTVPSLEDGEGKLPVPASIRGLAFLSQLAVYKDLVPGYRIRELTEIEQAEKVRDEVKRLREGEKMLVRSYKGYLKMLEQEIKRRSPLASLSLKCMSELLVSITHFNFSENIMGVLVGRLGRKRWDSDSDIVLESFIKVFKEDLTGVHSQTLVRLIARMIKERHFQVNPNVLTCLLHLRLRNELDQMKRGKNAKGGNASDKKQDDIKGKKFKSDIRKKWATKNQRRKEKEMKEVEKEMKEAEAEVDQEERAQVQTETLKNLFVLYFSILKSPTRTPLLSSALEGISAYAHFINIDFFRDLLAVLRRIISEQAHDDDTPQSDNDTDDEPNNAHGNNNSNSTSIQSEEKIRIRLLSILTAFDILSGQGEALNIDLSEFINDLFSLLRPISLNPHIEDPPLRSSTSKGTNTSSISEILFKCLELTFFSRTSGKSPSYRYGAFAKRLIECSLFFPAKTARASLAFARKLIAKEPTLECLLNTEDKLNDGVYKPDLNDPQLLNSFTTNVFECVLLGDRYYERGTREEMKKLRDNKAV
uniref:Nucleolar complex-associated protein 3 n=1 Tax=Kwoniella dejecticola CBS 10117 TaxID=1296121 RepID=A0A1A5ZYW1_9TREE|nr:nucleolar complex protein 3 [Kwoniella dejecticola CBS 10117]OBR82985.1 nucleolar complex protein 3 [Kwoniella dejecticola CBS 10117]